MLNIHIPRYERIWLIVGFATLGIFLVLSGFLAVSMNLNPPGHMMTIDPNALNQTPPFNNPGIQEVAPNEYRVVMVARMFMFQPNPISIPVGAKVHFQVTSPDVVHGLEIPRTNINMMVIPGHITEFTHIFKTPGDYLIVCHEYCGTGHHFMMGRLIVQ